MTARRTSPPARAPTPGAGEVDDDGSSGDPRQGPPRPAVARRARGMGAIHGDQGRRSDRGSIEGQVPGLRRHDAGAQPRRTLPVGTSWPACLEGWPDPLRLCQVKHYHSILHRGGQRMRTMRRRVVSRDGARCRRCGKAIDLTLSGRDPMGLSLGHIIPASLGGSDHESNLAPEHLGCNLGAGNAAPRARLATPPVFSGSGE